MAPNQLEGPVLRAPPLQPPAAAPMYESAGMQSAPGAPASYPSAPQNSGSGSGYGVPSASRVPMLQYSETPPRIPASAQPMGYDSQPASTPASGPMGYTVTSGAGMSGMSGMSDQLPRTPRTMSPPPPSWPRPDEVSGSDSSVPPPPPPMRRMPALYSNPASGSGASLGYQQ
jgi:hypothetical protein